MITAEYLCQLASEKKYYDRYSLEGILEECRVRAEGKETFIRKLYLDDEIKHKLEKLGFKVSYDSSNSFPYLISWPMKDIVRKASKNVSKDVTILNKDLLERIFGYDTGSGFVSYTPEQKLRVKSKLNSMSSEEFITFISIFCRERYLSNEAMKEGFSLLDVKEFIDWLADFMGIEL